MVQSRRTALYRHHRARAERCTVRAPPFSSLPAHRKSSTFAHGVHPDVLLVPLIFNDAVSTHSLPTLTPRPPSVAPLAHPLARLLGPHVSLPAPTPCPPFRQCPTSRPPSAPPPRAVPRAARAESPANSRIAVRARLRAGVVSTTSVDRALARTRSCRRWRCARCSSRIRSTPRAADEHEAQALEVGRENAGGATRAAAPRQRKRTGWPKFADARARSSALTAREGCRSRGKGSNRAAPCRIRQCHGKRDGKGG
ncbi:hypothetical protein B0H15DRAFT_293101 [Mycena belliarum]|uniref:Uncharacterized protein n=1 Tax=Mycena belliarum TaxID=1033014 RepID=A0AAD6U4U6_9AGAR|nr:hypothetical protein B0H15DRAFT_293101 [Mycena belliae]